jgi:hypothetical protein
VIPAKAETNDDQHAAQRRFRFSGRSSSTTAASTSTRIRHGE